MLELYLSQERLLQEYGEPLDRTTDVDWLLSDDHPMTVVDFAQWVDFSAASPTPRLGAFIASPGSDSSPFSVKFLKLDIPVSHKKVIELQLIKRRGLKALNAETEDTQQTLFDAATLIVNSLPAKSERVVLVMESSSALLPWTQVLSNAMVETGKETHEISICFHPSQLAQTNESDDRLGKINFVSNFDYEYFRRLYSSFPFEVQDLKEVAREEELMKDAAQAVGLEWQSSSPVFGLRNYGQSEVIHIAGHATSMDLRMIMQRQQAEEPHIQRLRREMGVWCRTPYVASTLVLAPNEAAMSVQGFNPFLTAATVLYLPYDPPSTVVLSTCNTVGGHSLPGKAPAGLAKAFWIWGVDHVIASSDSIPDDNPGRFLPQFYELSSDGRPLSRAFYESYRQSLKHDSGRATAVNWNFYGP